MSSGLTPSEKFVASLCQRSFLTLWTHPNPKGKKGKELCDCLIVCGAHVVVISVKEIEYRDTGDTTGWNRWTKAALEKSTDQIWGAERWLKSVDEVERKDGRVVSLPSKDVRQYHRIAVALGSRGHVPLKLGDFGNGFVHVCDEHSVGVLFSVLGTITDFVEFLSSVESWVSSGAKILVAGGGFEDLVGLYLSNNRSFRFGTDDGHEPGMVMLHDDLWSGFKKSDQFRDMRKELEPSYAWDRLIEFYASDLLTGGMFDMNREAVTDNELALATMALQPRWHRLVLAEAFIELLENSNLKVAARVAQGHSGSAFVFLIGSSEHRKSRVQTLALRCLVVRGKMPGVHTVVGIATDRPGTSKIGYSSDLAYIHMSEWTKENTEIVERIQNDLGYFKSVAWTSQPHAAQHKKR